MMESLTMALSTALLMGLAGSTHCIGMCGGIIGALSFSLADQSPFKRQCLLVGYQVGRLFSYVLIGLLAGSFGALVSSWGAQSVPRMVAGILLILFGLYLGDWWRGLLRLEAAGNMLWRYLSPLSKRLMPVKHLWQSLLLGGLWGWLPCGLVYTAVAYSATRADRLESGLIMLAFGLGTLPLLVAGAYLGGRVQSALKKKTLRRFLALLMMGFGVLTLWGASHSSHHHQPTTAEMPAHHHHH